MNDISTLIKDSFDVIGLILVFAFVLFDIRYPQIIKHLDQPAPPPDLVEERKIRRRELSRVLLISCLPLVLGYGILLYLFLPLLFNIFSISHLDLWHFDFLWSAFVVVFILIFIFFVWSVYLTLQMAIVIYKLRVDNK